MINCHPFSLVATKGMAGLLAGITCLLTSVIVHSSEPGTFETREQRMVSAYQSAVTAGNRTAAIEHVLDYSESVNGELAPETIKLMHRYGFLLLEDGRYREAIDVLKQTRSRSEKVYGEYGGEAFEINMNLGRAYSHRRTRWEPRLEYFDRALEILRERGDQDSITYVATLVGIVINLLNSDGLAGSQTVDFREISGIEELNEYQVPDQSEYRSNYRTPERYLLEAAEIGARLENMDEYISAKISVLHARLKVMETAELAAVPGGVEGFISKSTETSLYDREEERLNSAIDKLSGDIEKNQDFLDAANNILLQIAWLDKDEQRMVAMCANGAMNSAGDYPPDRLYEIMEGGKVFAPDVGVRVSSNIFKQFRSVRRQPRDEKGRPVKKPYFKPVCVDGQLMAALIHAPRVTVEEIR